MKKLNILDLHRMINERKSRTTECFEKVLDICHKKIVHNANKKQMNFFFEVPEFMFGYPLYDINECVTFVMNALKANGFLVVYFFPKFLYICWDLDEIERSKTQDKNKQTPKQMPQSHMIDFNYKPSGKLSLNI